MCVCFFPMVQTKYDHLIDFSNSKIHSFLAYRWIYHHHHHHKDKYYISSKKTKKVFSFIFDLVFLLSHLCVCVYPREKLFFATSAFVFIIVIVIRDCIQWQSLITIIIKLLNNYHMFFLAFKCSKIHRPMMIIKISNI